MIVVLNGMKLKLLRGIKENDFDNDLFLLNEIDF
jgi:hypothetical protein